MSPLISIIIVNYNAGFYLSRCLDSIENQVFQDFELIIVDNASQDQSLRDAERRPWVRIVRNSDNRGFAVAQNQGMCLSKGKYLMPLNFDIYLMPDFLEKVVSALEVNPNIGTVSGKLLRMLSDGSYTNEFDNAGLILSRRRRPIHRGSGETDRGQYQQRDLIFSAMGAAAVYRRDMLNDIAYKGQFFDESFFTWYEDIDLDWRARLRGWDCLYVPEAVAYHVRDPQKNLLTPFAARHSIRNRWQMIIANECPHCITRNITWLAQEEIAQLRHVLTHGQFQAYLLALAELITHLPVVLNKRRWVRSRALRACLPDYPLNLPS
jgi:GT2 family glycosyltransferase